MKVQQKIIMACIVSLAIFAELALALPAFPGAEGYGSQTAGGRGGQVIKVTNLNDSGSGSLRAALDASGPRIIVFEVSGLINLVDELRIVEPYITIAGETSPGGVMVTGRRVILQTHDVIMRHMRFRVGSHRIDDGVNPETLDSFDLYGAGGGHEPGVRNVIIDHCSFGWGVDETVTASYGASDFTIQWSVIAEGLSQAGHPKGEHSKGFLVSGKNAGGFDIRASFHHNYLAHNRSRNPEVGGSDEVSIRVDLRNNVVYNWYHALSPKSNGASEVNWVENYMKPGPESWGFPLRMDVYGSASPAVYIYRNFGTAQYDGSDPDVWNVGTGYDQLNTAPETWRKSTPHTTPYVTTSATSEDYAAKMLETVGATSPVRDSVDARIVNDFHNGTGKIRNDVSYPGDYPVFDTPAAPTDKDEDGMADVWEAENGFNTSVNDSALDSDSDGYTNIEEYLHSLAGGLVIAGPVPPAPPLGLEIKVN